ncbi:MAG TPA: aminotransferase class III-fold pyridoxal phosphate-dependent enzyme, partial [Thermoplasmata archaeon]|nr:aminotransferase class III-fold pyridoxal phosphate-dependent enzyme [Thermoplasmata archaeon]
SVEASIKLVKWYTRKPHLIAFVGAFHGRTMGSLALTASKPVHKEKFFPWMPGAIHVPYPNPYRPLRGVAPEDLTGLVIDLIERHIEAYLGDNVAGIFVEPVQGEGGYVVPPADFLPSLRKLATERGIPLVIDEVQSGFGRTGRMFACEHFDVVPDVITLAKGMGSGLPIGAIVIDRKMDFRVKGAHSNTYGGNLVASAAATATIEVIQSEGLLENAARQGDLIMSRLREIQERVPHLGDVRGLGLMIAAEFVRDPSTKEYAPRFRDSIVKEAYKRGLILLPCGRSAIRFIPPLVISEEDATAGMDVFEKSVDAAYKHTNFGH